MTETKRERLLKSIQIGFVLMLWLILSVPHMQVSAKTLRVKAGTGMQIHVSLKTLQVGKKASITVTPKADTPTCQRKIRKIVCRNLTPSIAVVSKKGRVRAKKVGTARIKVTVTYTCREQVYRKCIDGGDNRCWMTMKYSETKTVRIKIKKGPVVRVQPSTVLPVAGGSVQLRFICDGKLYAGPISIGVGIHPQTDYRDRFPKDPVREGYTFAGWYTKDGIRIGTTADEIYPAFERVVSGQTASVYARWMEE